MSAPILTVCPQCGNAYLVQQHEVSVHNSGALTCPNCGGVLLKWSGTVFYTLAVSPPPAGPSPES